MQKFLNYGDVLGFKVEDVSFFNPVYPSGKEQENEGVSSFGKFVEWYFDLGQEAYEVGSLDSEKDFVPLVKANRPTDGVVLLRVVSIGLKVISYLIIPIPLVMGSVKLAYRYNNKYRVQTKIDAATIEKHMAYKIPEIKDPKNVGLKELYALYQELYFQRETFQGVLQNSFVFLTKDQREHFSGLIQGCDTRIKELEKHQLSRSALLNKVKPKGIVNLGATCFMNAAIQAIVANINFRERIKSYEGPIEAMNCLKEFVVMYEREDTKPGDFRELALQLLGFYYQKRELSVDITAQQDATDVVGDILTMIEYSFPLVTTKRVSEKGFDKRSVDPYLFLELPVGKANSLQEMVDNYAIPRSNKDPSNTWNATHKDTKEVRPFIEWESVEKLEGDPPQYLQLQLNRGKQKTDGNISKVSDGFGIGNGELDLTSLFEREVDAPVKYRLVSGVVHQGTCNDGHYYTVARNAVGQWHRCDDRNIQATDFPKDELGRAYVIFLEKMDPEPAPEKGELSQ